MEDDCRKSVGSGFESLAAHETRRSKGLSSITRAKEPAVSWLAFFVFTGDDPLLAGH